MKEHDSAKVAALEVAGRIGEEASADGHLKPLPALMIRRIGGSRRPSGHLSGISARDC